MARVPTKGSKPEMAVRRICHRLGYRFRLHRRELPGHPDLVFPKLHKIIFVHGCFWHGHAHANCKLARMPKSRIEFWSEKISRNQARDAKVYGLLIAAGWQVGYVWECALNDPRFVEDQLLSFLSGEIEGQFELPA